MTGPEAGAATLPTHAISTGDGRSFECGSTDTLLRAALRAGVAATYECNSGGCGTCKFTLTSGEMHQLDPDAAGLTPRDKRKGKMLACQSVPLTDCEVALQAGDAWFADQSTPGVRSGRVTRVRHLTHDLREMTLTAPGAAEFLPGQFAMLTVPGAPIHRGSPDGAPRGLERAYSMSNLPNDDGQWQFQIKRVPGGAVSGIVVDDLDIGDEVLIDGPYGHAHLKDSGRDIVVVAGGSGLAPMVSVVRGLAERADAVDRRIDFYYGGRTPVDMCAIEFVDEVRDRVARVELVEAVSMDDADDGWTGPRGFIHALIDHDTVDGLADRDIYIAGPPMMTDAVVRKLVLELGVSTDNIHYDRFF
ncbi:oxidoreductase [Gordonia spumicola]|uniref:Oxidoreductase n=1 Tax=Gordonia spumicola TaxID=589161 RepID=A0A7I9VEE0_9ACTN|nr:2Fe-2S iron-sulfur cluster-binding protein [Gordonia spumicola]GEE03674.1 oxidoreductase [Gordonia spumicola]